MAALRTVITTSFLTVMQEEASLFGFRKKWSKTKILQVPSSTSNSTVQVAADGHVEVVDAFVCLGSMIDSSGGSRQYFVKIKRHNML